jgi:hypothetical protein
MIQEILSNSIILNLFGKHIRIENFTPYQKSMASKFSDDVYQYNFENGVYTDEEILSLLIENGLWSDQDEDEMKKISDQIDIVKMSYLENFLLPGKKQHIRRSLQILEDRMEELQRKRCYLSEFTCEFAKGEAYYFSLFENFEHAHILARKYMVSTIKESEIRSLYFSNTWRLIWGSCKDAMSIFGLHMNQLNDNQLNLIYWSKVYDSISESQEAPSYAVMKDPIAVDGWLLKQQKPKTNGVDDKNFGEVFKVVRNNEEQKEVLDLNAPDVKGLLKQKGREIKQKGTVDEIELSHVKHDVGMQVNAMNSKGKKR